MAVPAVIDDKRLQNTMSANAVAEVLNAGVGPHPAQRPLLFLRGLCVLLLVAMAAHAADPRLHPARSPWGNAQQPWSHNEYGPPFPAQDTVSCFCPAVLCSHGRMAGCTAQCYAPTKALCRCEADCDLYAKPVGSNLC